MNKKLNSLKLWQLLEEKFQEETLLGLHCYYSDTEREFGPRNESIKSIVIYFADIPDQLFVNCPTEDPPEDHIIGIFQSPGVDDNDEDVMFQGLERFAKVLKGNGYKNISEEEVLNLASEELYTNLGDTQLIVKNMKDLVSIDCDLENWCDYDPEDSSAIFESLMDCGMQTYAGAAFYYRQALLLEEVIKNSPEFNTTTDVKVLTAIHDSMEEVEEPMLKLAKQFANDPLENYLKNLGFISV